MKLVSRPVEQEIVRGHIAAETCSLFDRVSHRAFVYKAEKRVRGMPWQYNQKSSCLIREG